MTREYDPTGKSSSEPGAKLDAGKVPIYRGFVQQFPRAMNAVARVTAKGAAKYSWGGWLLVPDGQRRYADAQYRHENDIAMGLLMDEIGEPHLAQVAWNAMARLELWLLEQEHHQCREK